MKPLSFRVFNNNIVIFTYCNLRLRAATELLVGQQFEVDFGVILAIKKV